MMQLKVKRLDPRAVIPKYQSDGAACFDLVAIERTYVGPGIAFYNTGLAFDIPKGYVLEVYSRSGHGFNHHTRLANSVGIVDSDYRGEVMVKLIRDDGHTWIMPEVGERVAQAMLRIVDQVEFIEVDELSETKRGANGMGSTGK
jgi:dUTP pyrophosphatase